MSFWNRGKKQKEEKTAPIIVRRGNGNSGNRYPVEVKVLAARAKESGLDRKEVTDLIGASLNTLDKWSQMYQEISKMLNAKPTTIYQWAESGHISCLRINGCLRFSLEDIRDWIESCKKESHSGYNPFTQARCPGKRGGK